MEHSSRGSIGSRRSRAALVFTVLLAAAGCSDDDPTDGGSGNGGAGTGGNSGEGGGGDGGSGTGGRGGGSAASGGGSSGNGGTGGASGAGRGGSGGAGTSGAGASGAGAGGAGTGGMPPASSASVLERNNHPSRNGLFVQPTLTKAAVAKMQMDSAFNATFSGNMWASPLYVEDGPNDKGVFFAVTTSNNVYALDETSGAQVWMKNIGSSPTSTGAGCGNISPLGTISTPVIDAASRTIFVAGAIGTSNIARHEVHALNIDDGSSRAGWPLDVSKVKAGSVTFSPRPFNQRSALSLVGGTVYVAYGGHIGDCGDYKGWVLGVNATDPTLAGAWATRGRGEGIWAAGGMASDGTSVFAITGNNTSNATDRANTDGEQVVRLGGLAVLDRNAKNFYYPDHWRQMDQVDADFGGSSPVYISVPGATPEKYVVALAKDGHFYLLDAANLGGEGGHVVDFMIANGNMVVRTVPSAFPTDDGVNVVFTVDGGAVCPAGMPSGRVVMAVKVPPGSPPAPRVLWCASMTDAVATAPIVTTTDGKANAIVWIVRQNKLVALDGDTGAVLWNGGDANCMNVRKWTSPIAVKGRIIAGADGRLCSWSLP